MLWCWPGTERQQIAMQRLRRNKKMKLHNRTKNTSTSTIQIWHLMGKKTVDTKFIELCKSHLFNRNTKFVWDVWTRKEGLRSNIHWLFVDQRPKLLVCNFFFTLCNLFPRWDCNELLPCSCKSFPTCNHKQSYNLASMTEFENVCICNVRGPTCLCCAPLLKQ